MKKALFLLIGLQVVLSAAAQDQAVQEALTEVATQRKPQKESLTQKLKKFNKIVDYLRSARDCLRGIGCSKRQSYLANFALGAAIGAGNGLFQIALVTNLMKEKTRPSGIMIRKEILETVGGSLLILDILATELGYRYLAKDKIQLFRCLTFRGCNDQTKRYAFFRLGSVSSWLVVFNFMGARWRREEARRKEEGVEFRWEKDPRTGKWKGAYRKGKSAEWGGYADWSQFPGGAGPVPGEERPAPPLVFGSVKITDNKVKKELKLPTDQEYFQWYEVLGFTGQPDRDEARRAYRSFSRTYHPDISKLENKELAEEVFKAIASAGEYF